MKNWKLWKLIVLLLGTYIGLGMVFTISLFGATGQISEIFGSSSDWLLLWVNYSLGHSLASPSVKILFASTAFPGNPLLMTVFNISVLPGIISAILVGLFAKNSKIAFRLVFLFFIALSAVIIIFYAFGISLFSIELIENVSPNLFTMPDAVVIQWLVFIALFQSIFHGGIAAQIRNLIKRPQN